MSPARRVATNRSTITLVHRSKSLYAVTCVPFATETKVEFGNSRATVRAPEAQVRESRSPESTSVGTGG